MTVRAVFRLHLLAALLLAPAAGLQAQGVAQPAADDAEPGRFLQFGKDFGANCVVRNGVTITIRNAHPTRTLRVWLDRMHMGVGTGDRSRSDLAPGAEPEPLGCSRTDSGPQEWKLVRAAWVN